MKRKLAVIGLVISLLYLLTVGILPDPIFLIDEGIAFALLVKCAGYLGYDLMKYLPFLRMFREKKVVPAQEREDRKAKGVTIDV